MFDVTLTLIMQDELGAIVPPVIEIDVPPAAGVGEKLGEPHPDVVTLGGLARTTLAGRLSVMEACVRLLPDSLLVITMESWLVCPAQMVLGLKLLLTVGSGLPATFNVALAGVVLVIFMFPGPEALNARAGIVLIMLPELMEVTLTDTVHEPGVAPI